MTAMPTLTQPLSRDQLELLLKCSTRLDIDGNNCIFCELSVSDELPPVVRVNNSASVSVLMNFFEFFPTLRKLAFRGSHSLRVSRTVGAMSWPISHAEKPASVVVVQLLLLLLVAAAVVIRGTAAQTNYRGTTRKPQSVRVRRAFFRNFSSRFSVCVGKSRTVAVCHMQASAANFSSSADQFPDASCRIVRAAVRGEDVMRSPQSPRCSEDESADLKRCS